MLEEIKNKIILGDCVEQMRKLPDESIDLIVSSPPYYNLREYSQWKTYEDHLKDVEVWFKEMYRILKKGGHICWNVQENIPEPSRNGRNYYPLLPDTIKIAISNDLVWEKNVVWNKKNATQVLFGSYPYPPTPIFMDLVEYISVFRKKGKLSFTKEQKAECKVEKDRWFEISRNVWEIQPERASRIGHPAPYPVEIPKRFIEVMTVKDSIVLDPFSGSGTTAVACIELGRNYIGIEQNSSYCEIAEKRIEKAIKNLSKS